MLALAQQNNPNFEFPDPQISAVIRAVAASNQGSNVVVAVVNNCIYTVDLISGSMAVNSVDPDLPDLGRFDFRFEHAYWSSLLTPRNNRVAIDGLAQLLSKWCQFKDDRVLSGDHIQQHSVFLGAIKTVGGCLERQPIATDGYAHASRLGKGKECSLGARVLSLLLYLPPTNVALAQALPRVPTLYAVVNHSDSCNRVKGATKQLCNKSEQWAPFVHAIKDGVPSGIYEQRLIKDPLTHRTNADGAAYGCMAVAQYTVSLQLRGRKFDTVEEETAVAARLMSVKCIVSMKHDLLAHATLDAEQVGRDRVASESRRKSSVADCDNESGVDISRADANLNELTRLKSELSSLVVGPVSASRSIAAVEQRLRQENAKTRERLTLDSNMVAQLFDSYLAFQRTPAGRAELKRMFRPADGVVVVDNGMRQIDDSSSSDDDDEVRPSRDERIAMLAAIETEGAAIPMSELVENMRNNADQTFTQATLVQRPRPAAGEGVSNLTFDLDSVTIGTSKFAKLIESEEDTHILDCQDEFWDSGSVTMLVPRNLRSVANPPTYAFGINQKLGVPRYTATHLQQIAQLTAGDDGGVGCDVFVYDSGSPASDRHVFAQQVHDVRRRAILGACERNYGASNDAKGASFKASFVAFENGGVGSPGTPDQLRVHFPFDVLMNFVAIARDEKYPWSFLFHQFGQKSEPMNSTPSAIRLDIENVCGMPGTVGVDSSIGIVRRDPTPPPPSNFLIDDCSEILAMYTRSTSGPDSIIDFVSRVCRYFQLRMAVAVGTGLRSTTRLFGQTGDERLGWNISNDRIGGAAVTFRGNFGGMYQARTESDRVSRLGAKMPATCTNLNVRYPHLTQPDGSVVNLVDKSDREILQMSNLQIYAPLQLVAKNLQRPRGDHSKHSPLQLLVDGSPGEQQRMQAKVDKLRATINQLEHDGESVRELYSTVRMEYNCVFEINTSGDEAASTSCVNLPDVPEMLTRCARRVLWYTVADPLVTLYRDGDSWANWFMLIVQHILGLIGRLRDAAALHLITAQQRRRKLKPLIEYLEHLIFSTSAHRVRDFWCHC